VTIADPVLAEVVRGQLVESRHRGAVAVADVDGRLRHAIGTVSRPVYARSAIKPLQALPLLESGAAERFGLGDIEIALACASHEGEPAHVRAVATWLDRIGLSVGNLECGAHAPYHPATAEALLLEGRPFSAVHNNCSGKHTGFLTTAVHLGESTAGYVRADHPVQRRVRETLAAMCDRELSDAPGGVDGCGIPVIGIDLAGLATGMARLAAPDALPAARRSAAQRVARAMTAQPHYVAGTDRLCTALIRSGGGRFVAKVGAEGVFTAAIPELGLGVALKIDDGAARAAECAIVAVLERLGVVDKSLDATWQRWRQPEILNRRGEVTGHVRATGVLDALVKA
jgi:L-asparaginase II